jgi:hypothetical protein
LRDKVQVTQVDDDATLNRGQRTASQAIVKLALLVSFGDVWIKWIGL